MESSRPYLLIVADAPEALCTVFGVSLLERLLRIVQRLGFGEAGILTDSNEVTAYLKKPSWARANVTLSFFRKNSGPVRVGEIPAESNRILIVSAGFYYDARLLQALAGQNSTTLLVDSAPPADCARLWSKPSGVCGGAALVDRNWWSGKNPAAALMDELSSDAISGRINKWDAAQQPTYVMSRRKHVRPVFFPAPTPEIVRLAERFPREAAQNGVLDFPGVLHASIENWIVARLCHTSITPNQVTALTMLIGVTVTALFVTGHLWWGVALACAVGVLDGVDGKLARVKIETTAAGNWEHVIDFGIELSWWTALAYHFHTANLRSAYWLLLLLICSDGVDRLAKRIVKQKVGRNLDDVGNVDRFIRCIGSRRNINIWILVAALALGDAANGFVLICWWAAATGVAHVIRALQIQFEKPAALL